MTRVAAAALLLNLLLVCAMPAQAQEQRTAGPLLRAVQKEANRLVAAPEGECAACQVLRADARRAKAARGRERPLDAPASAVTRLLKAEG